MKNKSSIEKDKYLCYGHCYGFIDHDENGNEIHHPVCSAIDTCPVTRKQEGIATLVVVIVFLSLIVMFLGFVLLLAWSIISCIIGGFIQ